MKKVILLFMILFSAFSIFASEGGVDRNIAEYNLGENNLALKGYDPVNYFSDNAIKALLGQVQLEYREVTYKFISSENREKFIESPSKYEPTYGGWCATAMSKGKKVDIQPDVFLIEGNRLFMFGTQEAKDMWLREPKSFTHQADRHWFRISGEIPRS